MKGMMARGVFPQGTAVCYEEDFSLGKLLPQTEQARAAQLQSCGLPVTWETNRFGKYLNLPEIFGSGPRTVRMKRRDFVGFAIFVKINPTL